MTNKLTTVKRKARVGERILVTDAWTTGGQYKNGDTFTVNDFTIRGRGVRVDGVSLGIIHREYEVIVAEETPKPTPVSAALMAAHDAIDELRRKAYAEGFDAGRAFEKGESRGGIAEIEPKEAPQQMRDETIEQAKADIDAVKSEWNVRDDIPGGKMRYIHGYKVCSEEFIVNKEKRTVVCLLRWDYDNTLVAKGIAKCVPDDCFNVHIGKAIALRRALGLDVPAEYLNVPQPETVRVGDVVKWNEVYEVIGIRDGKYKFRSKRDGWISEYLNYTGLTISDKIIDDSRDVSE